MPKILVADDNSNVQKTVILALAGMGVEVVSVNNGEAAVRKLPDFSPDLVLADIFMPVRSGYEVCEYVKNLPRFASVPVVLLVGAFDPFDEREARRVGADGILKKPFVPPDPLITMVKMLLDRTTSRRPLEASASLPPEKKGAEAIAEVHAPVLEPSPQEFPAPAQPVAFGGSERPVAFGHLLDAQTPTAAPNAVGLEPPAADEEVLTVSRDATLGEPIFWRNESTEAEPEGERPPDRAAEPEVLTLATPEDFSPRLEKVGLAEPAALLELVRDQPEETSSTLVDSEPVVLDQAAQAVLTVDDCHAPEELATNSVDQPPASLLEESEELSQASPVPDEPVSGAAGAVDALERPEPEPAAEPSAECNGQEPVPAQPPSAQDPEDTARSLLQTDCMEPKPAPMECPELELSVEPSAECSGQEPVSAEPPSAQDPEDTARSLLQTDCTERTTAPDVSQSEMQPVPADVQPPAEVSEPDAEVSQNAPANALQPSAPDPALVEAVVQRVLDTMRPQVIEIITREFLRPVVLALVHREIVKQQNDEAVPALPPAQPL